MQQINGYGDRGHLIITIESLWNHSPWEKQAAEKLIERSNFATVSAAGAEARPHFGSFIGTTEVSPLLQIFVGLCLSEFFRSG
jgi:hypothetical protein